MSYNIIKGNGIVGGPNPPDGYFLAWSDADGYWIAKPGPSGSYSAGGDLAGSNSSQTVIGIQGYPVGAIAPTDSYVLTWVAANNRWEPQPSTGGGGGGFTAGGDLSGSSTNQNVIRINGATVPTSGALVTGNVLQVNGAASLTYGAINLAGGSAYVTGSLPAGNQASQTMGGDVTGSTAVATVLKINGVSIPASPATGTTIIATSPTTAIWTQIVDGYVAPGANIAGSKVASATTVSTGVIQLAGDLGGTGISPTVTGLNGVPVNPNGLSDGYFLAYSLADGYWKAKSAPTGSFTAAGDLSGNSSNQTVIRIQNNPVLSQALTVTEDGFVLTWDNTAGSWQAKAPTGGGGGGFTAGGDLSGTSTSQNVIRINGATVPASGALVPGNLLQVSGAAALTYGPLNLAGGSAYVTGLLPTTNQADQTVGGDLTGSTAIATVLRINGTSVPATPSANQVLVAVNGTASNWAQIIDANIDASAAITGSKITSATTGALGVIQLAGDLAGTATSPSVAKLNGVNVSGTIPTDGYVLTYNAAGTTWEPKAPTGGGGGGGFTAGGDLSGTSSNQTVTGIQTRAVNSIAPTDGYVLTWRQSDGYWAPKPIGTTTTSYKYAKPHDTTYSPIALFQFNGNINDSSGNNRHLTVNTGTEAYSEVSPTLQGIKFNNLKLTSTNAAFRLSGDMTIEFIMNMNPDNASDWAMIFSCSGAGEGQAENFLYSLYTRTPTQNRFFTSLWEYGAGVNVQFDNTGIVPYYQTIHIAYVREANVVSIYVNGQLYGNTSGTLLPPDGGTNTSFWVGGGLSDTNFSGIITSLKVIGRALTSIEVNSEFERTLGSLYSRDVLVSGYSGTSDGYQHLDILNGNFSNIGVGAGTFTRIGSVKLNTNLYTNTTYTFEAILEATTGQTAEIRLYNVTDGTIVNLSTLSTSANSPTVLTVNIVPTTGTKIYEAQIRVTGAPGINDGVICSGAQILVR